MEVGLFSLWFAVQANPNIAQVTKNTPSPAELDVMMPVLRERIQPLTPKLPNKAYKPRKKPRKVTMRALSIDDAIVTLLGASG